MFAVEQGNGPVLLLWDQIEMLERWYVYITADIGEAGWVAY